MVQFVNGKGNTPAAGRTECGLPIALLAEGWHVPELAKGVVSPATTPFA